MRSGERGRDGGSGVTGRAPWPHADPADKGARGRPGPPPARPLCSGERTPAGGALPPGEGRGRCRVNLERGSAPGPRVNPKSGFEKPRAGTKPPGRRAPGGEYLGAATLVFSQG